MNKPSPFSKTTKQLRLDLARAMTKAAQPGLRFADPCEPASNAIADEIEISERLRGLDGS